MKKSGGYRADTRLAHAGRDSKSHAGTVNPPVYHASTILYEDLEAVKSGPKPLRKGITQYGRAGTPTTFALEEAVAEIEGGYGAIALPSGLAAVAGAYLSFVEQGDHVLVSDSVYRPNRALCDGLLARIGVETTYYDPCIGAGIAELIQPNTRLVFVESPGSITFEVQDVPAIAAAAHGAGALVLMDNTWGTPLYCHPLELGADLSIHAATKYIVGHSDAMLGMIVTSEAHYDRIRLRTQELGYTVGPDDIYLGLRGLRTLSVRLARHQENALALANWLQRRPEVAQVLHPGLRDDPGHTLWRRDFSGACGLFGAILHPVPEPALAAMLDGLSLFGMGYSWGGYESLIVPTYPEKIRTATLWPAEGPSLRLHAGLEDIQDLIADLDAGFERLNAASGAGARARTGTK